MKISPIHSGSRGFALIAVLITLALVTILVVGYLSVVRTERSASQNFNDHNSAESIAMGVLNRLMAEHAVPKINGKPLAPFLVDGTSANPTGLPTSDTINNYFGGPGSIQSTARAALAPVYEIVPDDDTVFENIGLVRVSKPSTGGSATSGTSLAYNADYWAYDGITSAVLGTQVANPPQPPDNMVPQWVDYYQNDPATGQKQAYPTAKIAYAIWDEGGKLDINMSGSDTSVNGIAPHNLNLENALTNSPAQAQQLLDYLNNADSGDGMRERNNFSLRRVATGGTGALLNDTGDDRWIFSIRELMEKKLVDPNKLRQVTAFSRDFDVRPEWDGDRGSLALRQAEGRFSKFGAEDFLRSYVNNPDMFDLFFTANSNVDPDKMVLGTLNNALLLSQLEAVYPGQGAGQQENWMQIMRFLSILRRAMPPGPELVVPSSSSSPSEQLDNLSLTKWSNSDIWGIALNTLHATAPADDHNLFASKGSNGYGDINAREGIRIGPYVTAVSVKIKRVLSPATSTPDQAQFTATEYITVWNPYPFPLIKNDGSGPIPYRAGSFVTGFATGNNMGGVPDTNLLPGGPSFTTIPERDMWPSQVQYTGLTHPYPGPTNSGAPVLEGQLTDSSRVVPNLLPGHFGYVVLPSRNISPKQLQFQTQFGVGTMSGTSPGLVCDERTYVRNTDYYGEWDYDPGTPAGAVEDVYYSVNMMMPYFDTNFPGFHCWAYIPSSQMPKTLGAVYWYSFQIDDPRMGSCPRYVAQTDFVSSSPTAAPVFQNGSAYSYSWWGYPGQFSIDFNTLKAQVLTEAANQNDFKTGYNGKTFTVSGTAVPGYNANFGANWPLAPNSKTGIPSNDQTDFDLMMSTFGLPGRPFLNVGEVGNVFAERPWTTLGFANTINPLLTGTAAIQVMADDYTVSGTDAGNPPQRPAALLDYFTTVGTSTAAVNLNYRAPGPNTYGPTTTSLPAHVNPRYQEKAWLFDAVTGTNNVSTAATEQATGNLRPIRGRINLNTASQATLATLLQPPYRLPASIGLQDAAKTLGWTVTPVDTTAQTDLWITIDSNLVQQFASMIAKPVSDPHSIRPLRNLCDLSRIYDDSQDAAIMQQMYKKYPSSIINAIFGRLAQFGTVRSQIYTVDLVVRALSPQIEQKRLTNPSLQSVVKSEVRVQALVYFDTFSRKSYIESIKYQ